MEKLVKGLILLISACPFLTYMQLNKTFYVKPFCNCACRNIYSIICEEKTVKNWKSLIRWFSLLQKPFPTIQYQHTTSAVLLLTSTIRLFSFRLWCYGMDVQIYVSNKIFCCCCNAKKISQYTIIDKKYTLMFPGTISLLQRQDRKGQTVSIDTDSMILSMTLLSGEIF